MLAGTRALARVHRNDPIAVSGAWELAAQPGRFRQLWRLIRRVIVGMGLRGRAFAQHCPLLVSSATSSTVEDGEFRAIRHERRCEYRCCFATGAMQTRAPRSWPRGSRERRGFARERHAALATSPSMRTWC